MNTQLNIKQMLYKTSCILLIFSIGNSFAQTPKKIELLNADVLEYDEARGNKIKKLKGNVVFMHQNAKMYCDSAYLISESNSLEAFNNVKIEQGDSLNIYGDYLNYNGNNGIAEILDNVKLYHKDMLLTTNILNQNLKTKVASYSNGGKITDKENNLTSVSGFYYSKTHNYFFKDSVVLFTLNIK
jgi:Organic solvent tolerance protein OstA